MSAAGRLSRGLQRLDRHPRALLGLACLLLAGPALQLAWRGLSGRLGVNAAEVLVHRCGETALDLLFAALMVTPLRLLLVALAWCCGASAGRRAADWAWLHRLRRPIGIACALYAVAHVGLYAVLDLGLDPAAFVADLRDKPFVGAGAAAFGLLLPPALTSSDAWVRRLKRRWRQLHWCVHPAAVLALLHLAWLSKPGSPAPFAYAGVAGVLFVQRVLCWCRGPQRVARSFPHPGDPPCPAVIPASPALPPVASSLPAAPRRPMRPSTS